MSERKKTRKTDLLTLRAKRTGSTDVGKCRNFRSIVQAPASPARALCRPGLLGQVAGQCWLLCPVCSTKAKPAHPSTPHLPQPPASHQHVGQVGGRLLTSMNT